MAPDKLLAAIQECVNAAAEKGVEVKVEFDSFTFDHGSLKAIITATPKIKPARGET